MNLRPLLFLSLLIGLVGCGETGMGEVQIAAYGEPFIEDGIPSEEMDDGWAVDFSRFEATITNVSIAGETLEGRAVTLHEPTGGEGVELGRMPLPEGTYEEGRFTIERLEVVGSATLDARTVSFNWVFDMPTEYGPCAIETRVDDGGVGRFEVTVHADHLFYDSLVSDDPPLFFGPLADADVDGDNVLTQAELEQASVGSYDVGNADIDNLWDFLVAQSATVGHVNGEGHCDVE